MEKLGLKLKELRVKNRLTQQELADFIHVDSTSITKYEKDSTSIPLDKLELISVKFGMTLIEFLAYPDEVIVNKQQSIKIKNIKQKAEELLRQINEL